MEFGILMNVLVGENGKKFEKFEINI